LVAGTENSKSYGQILKSTAIFGGSSVINIAIGIIRTKILAVLLGPAGVGLMGMYSSIMNTTSGLAGMGLSSSGIREIADAEASGDAIRIASARQALRLATLAFGGVGALSLLLLCLPISKGVFGDAKHAGAVAWLSLGVAFSIFDGSQGALLNGLRRINDMARASIFGSIVGLAIASALIWGLRERGIALYLVAVTVTSYTVSYYFVRRLRLVSISADFIKIRSTINTLLSLGAVFMLSGLIYRGSQLLVRLIIVRTLGIEANGIFQAAITVTNIYLGLVLSSMAADYYPRLTGAASDQKLSNQLINEQTEVALLLGGPLILGMLAFAPLIIPLFYSAKFTGAIDILRWQLVGDIFKIVSWPLGFLVLARGMKRWFLLTESLWNVFFPIIVWVGIRRFGLGVTGIGYMLCYILHLCVMYLVAKWTNNFSLTLKNHKILLILVTLAVLTTLAAQSLAWLGYGIGLCAIIGFGWYATRSLNSSVGDGIAVRILLKFRVLLRLTNR